VDNDCEKIRMQPGVYRRHFKLATTAASRDPHSPPDRRRSGDLGREAGAEADIRADIRSEGRFVKLTVFSAAFWKISAAKIALKDVELSGKAR
jgi:hypothetical protein